MVPGAGIDFRLAGGGGCEIGRGVAAGSEAVEDDAEVASPGIRFGGVGGLDDGAEHHVDRRYVGLRDVGTQASGLLGSLEELGGQRCDAMFVVSTGRRAKVLIFTRGSRLRRWRKPNRPRPLTPTSMRPTVLVDSQPQSAPREMAISRPVRETPRIAAPRMSTRPGVRIGDLGTNRRVVAVASTPNEYVYEALRAGASGFLLKDTPPEELLAAVEIVARGDALLAPAVTRAVVEEFVRRPPPPAQRPARLEQLTAREAEVLHLLARGLANAEIAKELYITEATVRTHVAHVLQKLDLRDRIHAVIYAYETGLIQPDAAAYPS